MWQKTSDFNSKFRREIQNRMQLDVLYVQADTTQEAARRKQVFFLFFRAEWSSSCSAMCRIDGHCCHSLKRRVKFVTSSEKETVLYPFNVCSTMAIKR